jgi:signal transduction histidine kinase
VIAFIVLFGAAKGCLTLVARHLSRICTALPTMRTMARLQAGRVELRRSQVDLCDVLSRAMRSIEPLAAERGQTLLLQSPPHAVIAEVDGERLGRVLRDLLANAQKYGREDGHIWLTLEDRPSEACISVTDDGPGIAAEDRQRIFERFYRVKDSAAAGSGLAIALGLVELHGGRLWVESAPGAGSTFFITLPKRREL